ncbi:extracellular solute-binding protein [Kineococcus sp. SYSU DK001]|uniref:extracellular solute-binding protein n=1 Tax=Kineococcus sp. SYSU DK001 TaxID=3383122 RepID=UPI003D7DA65B
MATRTPSDRSTTTARGRVPLGRRGFLGLAGLGAAGPALGLQACSSGGSSGSSTDFVFTFWGTGAEKDAVTAVLGSAAQAAGLTAKPQSIPTNYETKINTLIAANTPPDAGYLTESMAMRLGAEGKLVNVADRFTNYLPQALHWYSEEGAVAQSCQEAMTLFFDTDAAASAGVTVPASMDGAWRWDDLVSAADRLTVDADGRHPSETGFKADQVERYGFAAPTGLPQLFALLKSNGVDLFTEDGTATNLDAPEAVAVLQDLCDLITEHRVSPTPAQATTFGASSSLLLASKRVAMVVDGTWGLLDLAASTVNYDVGVLPYHQEYVTTTLSGATAVFAASEHTDFGLDLMEQLADPGRVDLYSSGLWMPAIADCYTDEAKISQWTGGGAHPAGFRTAVIDTVIGNGVAYPSYKIKDFTTIATTITNAMGPIVTGAGDVTDRVEQLAATVNGQLKGAYLDQKA